MSYFNLQALTAPINTKEGLTHAVLQSVFNHAKSTQNDRARMQNDELGGCWSDEFVHGVGSRDWTLKREKLTEQTRLRAKRFYEDALEWLVKDSHIKTVNIDVFILSPKKLGRRVTLTLNNDTTVEIPL
ncbi:phage GP46 family protein [Aliivibrio fischeri]|uniref:phage GP46 family protein n=1 Tax=Aliivibrio fischeri TaxID=668 RepID=UPI0007C4AD77|nr:phage GP46 family protein [Aliivibrio fischeri]MBP3140843.1 phage GP46 family protein [Aliivibrio fischeri]MBP3155850.1 phage GP46 family protein [Aliivibrio fischeri]MCE7575299.1 phage GP46 family protein [Aliivibrio fischeri]